MDFLADTNLLLRWAYVQNPDYQLVRDVVEELHKRGDSIYLTPQNLIEFWNVSTRPANRNGFGLSPISTDREISRIETFFLMAPDTPAIYPEWRRLVVVAGVSGVQVHDARLAAVMRVHSISHILTFNTTDFARYPGITPVHPASL